MRFIRSAALAAGLALLPAAQAQIACGDVETLLGHAQDRFDDIIGEEVDTGIFETDAWLDGAEECRISLADSAVYACLWVFDTQTLASETYADNVTALAGCLADWDREALGKLDPADGLQQLDGVSFVLSTDEDEFEWIAYLEEHIEDDVTDWHIWLGVNVF